MEKWRFSKIRHYMKSINLNQIIKTCCIEWHLHYNHLPVCDKHMVAEQFVENSFLSHHRSWYWSSLVILRSEIGVWSLYWTGIQVNILSIPMKRRTSKRLYSQFSMSSPKVWADDTTIKLIRAMRLFPVLRRSFNRCKTEEANMEKVRLEHLMGCRIMDINRKWKTLRAYYNKLLMCNADKQSQWRFFNEMSTTISMDADSIEPSHSSAATSIQPVRIFDRFSSGRGLWNE